jgi:hypothetical protein
MSEHVHGYPVSRHTELVPQVRKWVLDALGLLTPDSEQITWEVGFQVLPDPGSEQDAWVPSLVLYLEVPISAENSYYAITHLSPFVVTEPQLRQAVGDSLGELLSRKAEYHRLTEADKT